MKAWVKERLIDFPTGPEAADVADLDQEALLEGELYGSTYYRAGDAVPRVGLGLVVTEDGIVPAHPPVRRVYHLANAITKYYYNPFYLEETAPGYEARIGRVGGRWVAFTRDGRWCPFTTDRAGDLLPAELFDGRPELVACASITGAETPYLTRFAADAGADLELRVFDLMEWDEPWPLPPEETYRLAEEHDLPVVRHWGPFTADDVDEVIGRARELAVEEVAGVIAKPVQHQHRPLKCSTPAVLGRSLGGWSELGTGPMEEPWLWAGRQLRGALAIVEQGRDHETIDWGRVGEGMVRPVLDAARAVAAGRPVVHEFTARFHDRDLAEAMVERLDEEGPDLEAEVDDLRDEDGGWRLDFRRRLTGVTGYLSSRLSGTSFLE